MIDKLNASPGRRAVGAQTPLRAGARRPGDHGGAAWADLIGPRTMFVAGIAPVSTARLRGLRVSRQGSALLIGFSAPRSRGLGRGHADAAGRWAIVTLTFPAQNGGGPRSASGGGRGRPGHDRRGPPLGGPARDPRSTGAWIFFVKPADRDRGPLGDLLHHSALSSPGDGTGSTSLGVGLGQPGPCWPSATGWWRGQRYDWGTVTSFISIPLIIGAGVVLLAVFLLVQKLRQER